MPTGVPEQLAGSLRGVLEPVVAEAGFELDDVEVRAAGRTHTVKVVVDVPEEGDRTGVPLDAIARLSRSAAAELDSHEHLFPGSYTLEVTSPGVDRPLTRPAHWRRAHLRLVKATLEAGGTVEVRVGDAGPESVTVVDAGVKRPEARELRYADVKRAVVQVEFKAPPPAEVQALGAEDGEGGESE
ncbi:ribosome maturation factor RimP [Pseudonocardia pini]|uniref:ribosome maturation factor RimP n=1 Tax=Pseudonocardia pini TaxID=2758030 RepID=UPI0015F114D3|nr:ribosome maturation factor RimP [Pseudonocardia pini]